MLLMIEFVEWPTAESELRADPDHVTASSPLTSTDTLLHSADLPFHRNSIKYRIESKYVH